MGKIEDRWRFGQTRRQALTSLVTMLAGSPLLHAQLDPRGLSEHTRVPGIDEMVTAFDFEPVCFANMTRERYDFMAHGDGSEFNLRRNRQAFDWVAIVKGKPIDPASVDLSTKLFGVALTHPIFVAPSSGHGALHPDGEIGTYRGATAARTITAIANVPTIAHPRIAASASGPRWNQFYPVPDLDASRRVLTQFQDLGTQAIIVTVDNQANYFERDLHNRNLGGNPRPPARGRGQAPQPDPENVRASANPATPSFPATSKYRVSNRRLWYNWAYLDELRKFVKVPMLIKGIVTAEDAELCIQRGFDGLIVSNHGGRSMDYGPSTLEALPEIVAAVRGRIPVVVDSGFRRGSDVFKALALGADAVELGRATRWGLGAFGASGVQRALEIVQQELVHAAASAGCATLKSIGRDTVKVNFV